MNSDSITGARQLGLPGRDGEDSRRPIQWDKPSEWDPETFGAFRDLIRVRDTHPALRRGGLRWLIATDDAVGYLREPEDERILVVVARSPWSGALLPAPLLRRNQGETLYGDDDLGVTGAALVIPVAGPSVGIRRLS